MDHPAEQNFKEPTDKKTRAGYGKFLRPNTPYDNFMESQGIPIYRDIGVRRVQDLPRKPWKRMGGSGTFIQLLGTEGLWGSYVVEVPGAGALSPIRWAGAGLRAAGRRNLSPASDPGRARR